MKPDFARSEAAATKLLMQQEIHAFATDLWHLKLDRPVYFDSIQNYCRLADLPPEHFTDSGVLKDGCTVAYRNMHLILYNIAEPNFGRLNWTVAHELGHIFLGHESDGETQEAEANHFAAQLLLPRSVILALYETLQYWDEHEIASLFGVSLTAARNRIESLYTAPYGLQRKEHTQLLQRYTPLLDEYFSHTEPRPLRTNQ
ncbi:MAG: ImmA/IrrE family metallo-endopeptidase [Clostridiales bacterium]|nr:ImmA/IrrE family metallo-endopeptidase [Clostridiales bacterium]